MVVTSVTGGPIRISCVKDWAWLRPTLADRRLSLGLVAAALLIKDERKINQMALEFSAMLSSAPRVLGAVHADFKEKYPVVVEAQERAKERLRIARQQESWRQEQAYKEGQALGVGLFLTLVLTAWLWAVWIRLFTGA